MSEDRKLGAKGMIAYWLGEAILQLGKDNLSGCWEKLELASDELARYAGKRGKKLVCSWEKGESPNETQKNT